MDSPRSSFPTCPSCTGESRPTTVMARDRKRIVTYVCQSCGHTWTVTSDDTDMMVPFRKN